MRFQMVGWTISGFWLIACATLPLLGSSGLEREQGRSMAVSQQGIVAAESPLAAEAGVRMLEAGGNAIDAAIATNAAMGVVAPMMNGMGGDLFALVYDAKARRYFGLNASGWTPRGLTIEFLRRKGLKEMPELGVDSVSVPGAVDGWQQLAARFGRKTLAQDLAAAIHLARQGFPVPELTAAFWIKFESELRQDPGAAATYLIGGKAPRLGQLYRNPDLAQSLEQVAAGGRDAFYRGEIAQRILALMQSRGGAMTAEDLAEYAGEWADPIATTYRGWRVYEMPPNGSGLAALVMLNVMERFPLRASGFGTVATLHTLIEAKKVAYADVARYAGDPRFHRLPLATLLSESWAAKRARAIDPNRAQANVAGGEMERGGDTTYLCVVDRDGNMVSLIQSNSASFGSGVVAPGTGFVLHNRARMFSWDKASPNRLEGRKRPLHTIIPAFAETGTKRVAFGIVGGWTQAQAHAQFIADLVDFDMNIQEALDAPRFSKRTFGGNDVEVEGRFSAAVRKGLEAKGHVLTVHGSYSDAMGGGQAILRDLTTGVNYGASDPRKDGAAATELPSD